MQSYWQIVAPKSLPALQGHRDTDIAIVGGGYTGCWLAYWLRDSGLRVTVVEREFPGFGASGRNGGLLLQGPAQLLGEASRLIGTQAALQFLLLTRRTFEWLEPLRTQYDLDYRQTGSLYLGGDLGENPVIESTVDLFQEAGIPAYLLERREQPASLQNLGYGLGAYFPSDGMVHPLKLITALLSEAQAHGVQVFAHTAVEQYEEDAKGITLLGSDFQLSASRVVIATNAYTGSWFPMLNAALNPVRGQVSASEPVVPLDYPYPVYADHGFNYWHQRPNGSIILGGFRDIALQEEVGTSLQLHGRIQAALTDFLTALAGKPVKVAQRWAGIMAMTPDHLPYVGPLTGRIWIAAGYNGHGSTVAPVLSRMIRDALLDGTPIFAPYDVRRLYLH